MVRRAPDPAPRGRDEPIAPTPERVAEFSKLVRAWFWADRQRREAEDSKADRVPPHVERLLAPYKVKGDGGETHEQWVERLLATASAECGTARELVAFGRQLALDLEAQGFDSRPVLLVVQAADGGGGVAALTGTWPAARVEIERIRLLLQVSASTSRSSAQAVQGGERFVATERVSSPTPSSNAVTKGGSEVLGAETSARGDEAGASKPASEAGVGRVSSPALPAKALVAGGPSPTGSTGGDGTETSQTAPQAGLAEAAPPGVPHAEVAAGGGERVLAAAGAGQRPGTSIPILVRSGVTWSVTWKERTHTILHRLGLEDLQVLLSKPRVPVACTDLVRGRLVEGVRPDEKADKEAVARIRRALDDLDGMHSEGAEEQRARLEAALKDLVAPGGRLRVMNVERRRTQQTVSKRIRDAVRAIGEVNPEFAAHLMACLTTGAQCCYDPLRVQQAAARRP